jgi:hypothetical protein
VQYQWPAATFRAYRLEVSQRELFCVRDHLLSRAVLAAASAAAGGSKRRGGEATGDANAMDDELRDIRSG